MGDGLVVIGTVFASLYVVLTSRFALEAQPLHLAARQQGVGRGFALALWAARSSRGRRRLHWGQLRGRAGC